MTKEIKICLPVYKIVYSMAFIVLLSLVRGISDEVEIGIAMEPAIALLTLVFCADTYVIELLEKRGEVFSLYAMKEKTKAVTRRLLIQISYLIGIAVLGYGFFYWQKPMVPDKRLSAVFFAMFLIAIIGTILFWGILSMTITNLLRSIWTGIGGSLLLWTILNSKAGDRLLGSWNVFSFSLREIKQLHSWDWMCGKTMSCVLAMGMLAVLPVILKKRG